MFETVQTTTDILSAAGAILGNGWVKLFVLPSLVVLGWCVYDAWANPARYAPNRARAGWIALAVAVLSILAGTWHYHHAQSQWQQIQGFENAQPVWELE